MKASPLLGVLLLCVTQPGGGTGPIIALRGGSGARDFHRDVSDPDGPAPSSVLQQGSARMTQSLSGLDVSSYNTLIGACATSAISSDVVEQVLRALNLMEQANVKCDGPAYSALLTTCGQATGGSGGIEEGIQVLEALKAAGVHPDAACYNSLMGACAAVALGSEGLNLAKVVLSSMRNSTASKGLLAQDMRELIRIASTVGGVSGAVFKGVALLEEMVAEGYGPESVTCNALLEACTDMAAANGLLSQGMEALGSARGMYVPEAAPYNMLLESLCGSSLAGLVLGVKVTKIMRMNGVFLDQDMASAIVGEAANVALGGGALGNARLLLDQAMDAGIPAALLECQAVASAFSAACGEMGAVEHGLAQIREIREAGLIPTAEACTRMLDACCSLALGEGVLGIALDLLKVMLENSVKPSTGLMRDMLEACVLAGGPGGALWQCVEVLREMKLGGVPPTLKDMNKVLSTCARMAESEGALEQGLHLIQTATRSGSRLHPQLCSDLLTACAESMGTGSEKGTETLVSLAREILALFSSFDLKADTESISYVMRVYIAGNGAGSVSLLRLGREVLHSLVDYGMKPTMESCKLFLGACSAADPVQGLQDAVNLIDENSETSDSMYASVLETCVRAAVGEGALRQGTIAVQLLLGKGWGLPPDALNRLLASSARACGGTSAITPAVSILSMMKARGFAPDQATCNALLKAGGKVRESSLEVSLKLLELAKGDEETIKGIDINSLRSPRRTPSKSRAPERDTPFSAQTPKSRVPEMDIPFSTPTPRSRVVSEQTPRSRGYDRDMPHSTPRSLIKRSNRPDMKQPKTPTPMLSATKMLPRTNTRSSSPPGEIRRKIKEFE